MSARPPSLTPKGSKFGIIRHSLSTLLERDYGTRDPSHKVNIT